MTNPNFEGQELEDFDPDSLGAEGAAYSAEHRDESQHIENAEGITFPVRSLCLDIPNMLPEQVKEAAKSMVRQLFEGQEGVLSLEEAFDLFNECREIIKNRTEAALTAQDEAFRAEELKLQRLQQLNYRLINQ